MPLNRPTMPRSAAKILKAKNDMLAEVKRVVDSNTATDRLGVGSLYVRDTKGKRVRLIGVDGKATQFGDMYFAELGIDKPPNYDYAQELLDDAFVLDRQGKRVTVRRRAADGVAWVITKAGEAYFKFNRTEFKPRIPFLIAKPLTVDRQSVPRLVLVMNHPDSAHGEPVEIVRPARAENYMGLPNFDTFTVGRVRQAREGRRPLLANRDEQEAEMREAALAFIQTQPRLVDLYGVEYRVIGQASSIWYVYDVDRPILIDSSTVNYWNAGRTDAEVVLSRPLRDFAIPGGFWRPFDLHPDSFYNYSHGCAVQMLHKSITKRPGGQARVRAKQDGVMLAPPEMTFSVQEVADELDICFDEMGYVIGEWPYGDPGGWRQTGVTCQAGRLRSASGNPSTRRTP